MRDERLPSIDPQDLTKVGGGSVAGSTAVTLDRKKVQTLMQSLHSSLKDLTSNKYSANTSITQLQPFFGRRALP